MNPGGRIDANYRLQNLPASERAAFVVKDGGLFCSACAKFVNFAKLDTLRDHYEGKVHRKFVLESKANGWQQPFLDSCRATAEEIGARGSNSRDFPFRQDLVIACMQSGIPLTKVSAKTPIANFLHKYAGLRVPGRTSLRELVIPAALSEKARVAKVVAGSPVGLIFDSSCRDGELLAVVARTVDRDRLVRRAYQRNIKSDCNDA